MLEKLMRGWSACWPSWACRCLPEVNWTVQHCSCGSWCVSGVHIPELSLKQNKDIVVHVNIYILTAMNKCDGTKESRHAPLRINCRHLLLCPMPLLVVVFVYGFFVLSKCIMTLMPRPSDLYFSLSSFLAFNDLFEVHKYRVCMCMIVFICC